MPLVFQFERMAMIMKHQMQELDNRLKKISSLL